MDTLKTKKVLQKTFNLLLETISIRSSKYKIKVCQKIYTFLPLKKAHIYKL